MIIRPAVWHPGPRRRGSVPERLWRIQPSCHTASLAALRWIALVVTMSRSSTARQIPKAIAGFRSVSRDSRPHRLYLSRRRHCLHPDAPLALGAAGWFVAMMAFNALSAANGLPSRIVFLTGSGLSATVPCWNHTFRHRDIRHFSRPHRWQTLRHKIYLGLAFGVLALIADGFSPRSASPRSGPRPPGAVQYWRCRFAIHRALLDLRPEEEDRMAFFARPAGSNTLTTYLLPTSGTTSLPRRESTSSTTTSLMAGRGLYAAPFSQRSFSPWPLS